VPVPGPGPLVAVRTALLQQAMPELPLRPGASVVARVASRAEQHGVLVLAGVPLHAQLPDEVPAGSTLRLLVREVTPERVTLSLDGPPVLPVPPPPMAQRRDPPASLTVQEPPRRRTAPGGEEVSGVTLAFHSAALGRLDLRVELSASRVSATVDAAAGGAHAGAAAAAERLRDALMAATEREAVVEVRPRREPVDLYA
jgi:hypothetical protein